MFAKPGYFVVVDRLRSSSTHKYEFYAHIGPESKTASASSISIEGNWVKGTVGSDVLGINVVAPSAFAYSTGVSSCPDDNQDYNKAYVSIRPQSNVASTTFATVLYPTTSSGWSSKPTVESLGITESGTGVRVHYNGVQDHLFRYGIIKSETAIGNYTMNADAASVAKDSSGNIEKIFVVNGTKLYENGVAIAESYSGLTFEADYSDTVLNIYGDGSEEITGLTIFAPDTQTVTIDGKSANAEKTGDYMSISGPKVSICGAADSDSDSKITSQEIKNYIDKWRTSGSVTLKSLISAIVNWKTVCKE
jgi:hypothetical protein